MGCQNSHEASIGVRNHHLLVVATLNYGGILNSPMEFFSDSQSQQHQISVLFKSLIPFYVPNFDEKTFKWDVGKIDQKIQVERYTPIYRANVGVEDNKLIGQKEFERKWDQCYQKAISKKRVEPQPTEQQIKNMKLFDLVCYHTLVKYVYKINDLKQVESGKFPPKDYIALTQKYFSRSYLNETKKIKKIKQALKKHSADVFFFQQPTKAFIEAMMEDQTFYVREKGYDISMLLIRKSSFTNIDKDDEYLKKMLTKTQYQHLNWDGDTCFVVCDNLILISGHLSSKKDKNLKQVQQMKASLNNMKQKCIGYHIVVGADTNSFVTTSGMDSFYSFPNAKVDITTRKKRTFMQPQFNKADAINEQCKDQVFSTMKIVENKIITIDNQQVDKQAKSKKLLPTQDHPFDHFMVLCTLQRV